MVHVTANVMVSLDGYAAGPDRSQTSESPFGDCDFEMFARWRFGDVDANAAEIGSAVGADAYVMGRNMFTPGRGEHDLGWTGWWGDDPPYRAPVFVVTHHEREPLAMAGGTTFTFVTSGLRDAFHRAVAVAGDRAGEGDVSRSRVGSRPSTSAWRQVWSTSCACTWPPWCSAAVSACSTGCRASGSSRSPAVPPST